MGYEIVANYRIYIQSFCSESPYKRCSSFIHSIKSFFFSRVVAIRQMAIGAGSCEKQNWSRPLGSVFFFGHFSNPESNSIPSVARDTKSFSEAASFSSKPQDLNSISAKAWQFTFLIFPKRVRIKLHTHNYLHECRCQCTRVLRRTSAAALLLGLRVWISRGARMSVCCDCFVLSGRGLCVCLSVIMKFGQLGAPGQLGRKLSFHKEILHEYLKIFINLLATDFFKF